MPFPPTVDYTAEDQVRTADEEWTLPKGAASFRMLSGCGVLRYHVHTRQRWDGQEGDRAVAEAQADSAEGETNGGPTQNDDAGNR